ncbi:MAG: magnesium/cobalt transporter CorA [Spirochaetales bacterium]|nr:magnesium/cobalt transporter CorA [Spirochaetales bacterium]
MPENSVSARSSLLRFLPRRSQKAGLPPGTPVHIGESRAERVRITAFEYSEEQCRERQLAAPQECAELGRAGGTIWINVDGVHDISVIQKIGELYAIHPLVQEDIANTGQRTKVESYDGSLFVILKMLCQGGEDKEVRSEQVSLFLRDGLVISFQEQEGDVFEPIRERLRQGKGQVRRRGSDYLAYCLIDAIVDEYFLILEDLEERIAPLEEAAVQNPEPPLMHSIQEVKRELIFLRRTLWPLREMLSRLEREGPPLVRRETIPFLRDVHDHTIQIIEILESFQEIVSSLMDIYMTSVSNRMNSIMKVLTIIATIFIPLTFIAGVYGMNFRNMPELQWRWGYPVVLGAMGAVFVGMLLFFRSRKWL